MTMSTTDRLALKEFDALAAKLAPLERKRTCTYDDLMRSARLMERMSAIRDGASPSVRRELKKRGWN
jgi:hypothetical protein